MALSFTIIISNTLLYFSWWSRQHFNELDAAARWQASAQLRTESVTPLYHFEGTAFNIAAVPAYGLLIVLAERKGQIYALTYCLWTARGVEE